MLHISNNIIYYPSIITSSIFFHIILIFSNFPQMYKNNPHSINYI